MHAAVLTPGSLCLPPQHGEGGLPQHLLQAAGETGRVTGREGGGAFLTSAFSPQAADDVSVAMERVCGTLEQESARLTQAMGESIFELFISLKILKGFREFLPLKFVPV